MNRQQILKTLKDKTITITSSTLESLSYDLYDAIEQQLTSFVNDPTNNATKENLNQYLNGNYYISLTFTDSIQFTAGPTIKSVNDQPYWDSIPYTHINTVILNNIKEHDKLMED